MEGEKIKCNCCGEVSSVVLTASNGINASRLQEIGWVSKCDVIFASAADKPSSWFAYCGEGCKNKHYKPHLASLGLSQEGLDKINSRMAEIRLSIPRAAKMAAIEVQKTMDALRPVRKPKW